jgi:predicted HTH transcriptional regulator
MYELIARVPFDDRINQEATIDDFDLMLIQAYLHEVKSDLYEESKRIDMADLVRNMHIAKGSDEFLRPVNVGLLFFSRTSEKFFDRSWIEVVWHKDNVGDNFTELDLTEGRGTGFPKLYKKMKDNGSSQPIIETDEENNYFMVTLPIHPRSLSSNRQ